MPPYECKIIRHLRRKTRGIYLNFLIENGLESRQFYKYALKRAKKLILCSQDGVICGIVGFSDSIAIVKSVTIPRWFILDISFIYCIDNMLLFKYMIELMAEYALNHDQCEIIFRHVHTPVHIESLLAEGYHSSECQYCSTALNKWSEHDFYKEVSNITTCRKIYDKYYDPNFDYKSFYADYYKDY